MKQTVTLYIHRNLDFCEANAAYTPEFIIYTFDASNLEHANYVLLGTQEIEANIPDVDYREQALAKIDEQIKSVKANASCEASRLEARKAELLAIGNEVAA